MNEPRPASDRDEPRFGSIVSWTRNGVLRVVIGVAPDGSLISLRLNRHSPRHIETGRRWQHDKVDEGWWVHE